MIEIEKKKIHLLIFSYRTYFCPSMSVMSWWKDGYGCWTHWEPRTNVLCSFHVPVCSSLCWNYALKNKWKYLVKLKTIVNFGILKNIGHKDRATASSASCSLEKFQLWGLSPHFTKKSSRAIFLRIWHVPRAVVNIF